MMDGSRSYLTQRNESFWSRRSTIERQLVICCCLLAFITLALVITVSVLAAGKRHKPHSDKEEVSKIAVENICLSAECVRSAVLLLDSINTSVDPCTDFYAFTCDGWRQKNHMPDDRGRYGSFDILAGEILGIYKNLLTKSKLDGESQAVKKTRDMYKLCLNYELIWNKTYSQVIDVLTSFGGWPLITPNWTDTNFDWMKIEAEMVRNPPSPIDEISSFVNVFVNFNERNTSETTILLDQPVLALARDYLIHPQNYTTQVKAYITLITKVAKYLGNQSDEEIKSQVTNMIKLEKEIAEKSTSPEEKRRIKFHTNLTLAQLRKRTNNEIDWLKLIKLIFEDTADINENEQVFLQDEKYIDSLAEIMRNFDNKTKANYILWYYLFPMLTHMSEKTEHYYYEFAMALTGVTSQPPRWKACIGDLDAGIGMGLGRLFVDEAFQADVKVQAAEMIAEIQDTFIDMLKDVEWMDNTTKVAAIDKAKSITHNIGYPEWILDDKALDEYYNEVSISDDDYWHNLRSTAKAIANRDLLTLRKRPVDKSKWYMTPGTVNAYYLSELNSVNFPAGILQNPFFMAKRPMAMNFGGIGAVIGHEITHGFDDEGRLHDKTGSLEDWWSDEAITNFKERSNCYVEQYHEFCPEELENKCVNGNNTLGENIADNGGIKAAFKAYKKWVKKNGEENRLPGLQQYSLDQIFFMSFGQLWCSNMRPETLLNLILKDPHSPTKYRVLGTVANSEEFSKAFNCGPKSEMNRNQKCHLW